MYGERDTGNLLGDEGVRLWPIEKFGRCSVISFVCISLVNVGCEELGFSTHHVFNA